MALDTFDYCVNIQNGGSFTNSNNVRVVSFGNGFEQRGSGGYRTNKRTYAISYTGSRFNEVIEFMENHIVTPFFWKTPQGETRIFVVSQDSIGASPVSSGVQTVMCSFTEVFTSAS